MLAGVTFLRQQQREQRFADGRRHVGFAPEANNRAELRIELGWFAVDDVALQRRGGLGRQAVEPSESPSDCSVAAEVDAARVGNVDDLANGACGELPRL